MSQVGRPVKNLETPRPLKLSSRQTHNHTPQYESQSIEGLITLVENVATTLSNGCNEQEGMTKLLSNLRMLGPQLEIFAKDTLDRAFVTFRNASQDERLNIMTRLNLLELIELRAKSWQISDGINSYYKHKATNVEPESTNSLSTFNEMTMLSTSPTGMALGQTPGHIILNPGEVIRTSGKFPKPTKIPGKNYSKDEVVIRNADSGKVMGIKGRRVHMIEELSETIISFQRVNPGAKERLVQITGPSEEKINYAKQLIEETIRRNASPVRLEAPQGGSCSSLASSASDETAPRTNRHSIGAMVTPGGNINNFVPNSLSNVGGNLKLSRNSGGGQNMLLHSYSTNDASLGEYKHTVTVGHHNIKITGDCLDLVRVAKLVLDDYFSSNEFEAGMFEPASQISTPLNPYAPSMIPQSHQLISSSPFVDSGISLDLLSQIPQTITNNNSYEIDDDVFIVETPNQSHHTSVESSSSTASTSTPMNGLTRSRRSHFSRKDSTPELNKETNKEKEVKSKIVHEYERLLYYSKSPHSLALPRNWSEITEKHPWIVKNKVIDEKNCFDPDKHLSQLKSGEYTTLAPEPTSESPELIE